MKVLFLDIDGVLNSIKWCKSRVRYPAPRTREQYNEMEFDPEAVKLLKRIIKETGCKVVLSSVWRLNQENRVAVRKYAVPFIDCTPHIPRPSSSSWEYRERGREVLAWIMANEVVDNYAILDDDSDFFDWQPLFQTKNKTGLTVTTANKVIRHLNK